MAIDQLNNALARLAKAVDLVRDRTCGACGPDSPDKVPAERPGGCSALANTLFGAAYSVDAAASELTRIMERYEF